MDKESAISKILNFCNRDDQQVISSAYADGGIEPLFPRLQRAAIDQIGSDDATYSRYAIWANTVRDNVRSAVDLLKKGDQREAERPV
jgi:hypothetical protein